MRRSLFSVLTLCLMLALSACNEDEGESVSFGGEATLSRAPAGGFVAQDIVSSEMAKSVPQPASATIVDRSKLGDRRVAETHSFNIELGAEQIQARIMADYQACIALGCEVMGSGFQSKSSGNLYARVPPDKLATFFEKIESGPGTVKQHQVSVDDETSAYVDTAARLKNQIALRDRLTALLQDERTKTVSDIMQIERELNRVQSDIDATTARMNALEKRTAMATVNVHYEVPFYERGDHYIKFKTSFSRAWRGFVENLDSVIVFVGRTLPWIPVILIGFWLAAKVLRSGFSASVGFFRRKKRD